MNLQNAFAYPEPVWSRFTTPAHAGEIADGAGVFAAEVGSAAAKSLLRLQVQMVHGQVVQVRFKAYGCPSAISVGEWLAQALEGSAPEQWTALSAAKIRVALEIPDDRAHCALMGEDAVRALKQQVCA